MEINEIKNKKEVLRKDIIKLIQGFEEETQINIDGEVSGSEFSKQLTKVIGYAGINHRHSRVRTPTDNGHIERFIRTLQDECLHKIPRNIQIWKREIPEFLNYYNTKRPHMGLNFKTPMQVVRSY